MMIRQGDVLVVRSKTITIPKEAKAVPPDQGRTILAYGEVTGHAHALPGTKTKLFRADDNVLTAYLHVEQPAKLVHDEHRGITLQPGRYRVIQQRQWTMARQIQRVAD